MATKTTAHLDSEAFTVEDIWVFTPSPYGENSFWLLLDLRDGEITVSEQWGDGIPAHVYEGHAVRWSLPDNVDAQELAAEVERLLPWFQELCALYSELPFNGITDDKSLDIQRHIQDRLSNVDTHGGVYKAAEWLDQAYGYGVQNPVTASTTDKELAELAHQHYLDAAGINAKVSEPALLAELTEIRDTKRAAAALGSRKSEKKAAASAANGRKGGRPARVSRLEVDNNPGTIWLHAWSRKARVDGLTFIFEKAHREWRWYYAPGHYEVMTGSGVAEKLREQFEGNRPSSITLKVRKPTITAYYFYTALKPGSPEHSQVLPVLERLNQWAMGTGYTSERQRLEMALVEEFGNEKIKELKIQLYGEEVEL